VPAAGPRQLPVTRKRSMTFLSERAAGLTMLSGAEARTVLAGERPPNLVRLTTCLALLEHAILRCRAAKDELTPMVVSVSVSIPPSTPSSGWSPSVQLPAGIRLPLPSLGSGVGQGQLTAAASARQLSRGTTAHGRAPTSSGSGMTSLSSGITSPASGCRRVASRSPVRRPAARSQRCIARGTSPGGSSASGVRRLTGWRER
jgi:hypothetical protein